MPTEQTCDFETMAATTEQHQSFEHFAGTFKAVVKMWMGPGDPMESTGVMTNTVELDGRFLHQAYQGDATEGPFPNFAGRGYWGYNTQAGKWEGVWMDTATTVMQIETGDVDATGKVWTMTGETFNPETNGPMIKKSLITLKDNDHHSMEMSFITADGNETKVMEIQYTRA